MNSLLFVLAVGFFAFDQVRSLQGNTGKQSSGSAVGEDRRGAAKSNVSLHIPEREEDKGNTQTTSHHESALR